MGWHWVTYNYSFNKVVRPVPFISVVVAFKNESNTLPKLLERLQQQTLSKDFFEIVLVNDNSTDGDYRYLVQENIQLINATGAGKKAALQQAITHAKGDLIVTTDADCLPSLDWLRTISNAYQRSNASMLVCPVSLTHVQSSFLHGFQHADFMALQISGAGAVIGNRAVFCNGANLSFAKKDWFKAVSIQDGKIFASGDDVFLLHAFKKLKLPILYLKDSRAVMVTGPKKTWRDFMRQRIRWGGKSTGYRDKDALLLAFTVFLSNLFLLSLFLLSIWEISFLAYFFIFFSLKLAADFFLLKSGQSFFNYKIRFFSFLFYSLLFPCYVVYAALAGMFCKEKW